MPASPLAPWSLIALLLALPAAAQDAAPDTEAADAEAPATEAQDAAAAPEPAEPEATSEGSEAPGAGTSDPEASGAATSDAEAASPEAAAPAEGAGEEPLGLSLGDQREPQVGQAYVRDAFTDWELRCERVEEGEDPCQLYQLLADQQDNPVAEIYVFALPDGTQAAAGATIITPLMTLLTEQLTITVDDGRAKRYPFSWCDAAGCVARVGFTEEEMQGFRRGNVARVTIVPVAAPDQKVDLDVSLSGFTAGFEAVQDSGLLTQP